MGYFLIFLIYCVFLVGAVIATFFISGYSIPLAILFDIVYLIAVKLFFDEIENQ